MQQHNLVQVQPLLQKSWRGVVNKGGSTWEETDSTAPQTRSRKLSPKSKEFEARRARRSAARPVASNHSASPTGERVGETRSVERDGAPPLSGSGASPQLLLSQAASFDALPPRTSTKGGNKATALQSLSRGRMKKAQRRTQRSASQSLSKARPASRAAAPVVDSPQELRAQVARSFYRELLATGKRPLSRAKLMVVGSGYAGKTSLINRLVRCVQLRPPVRAPFFFRRVPVACSSPCALALLSVGLPLPYSRPLRLLPLLTAESPPLLQSLIPTQSPIC